MRLKIVAVRDKVADAFGQPNFVVSLGAAIRSFSDEVRRRPENGGPVNPLNQHPGDFDLYNLGEYDDGNGEFFPEFPPKQIAVGDNFKD